MTTIDKLGRILADNGVEITDCFAVPGADSIIDMVRPETGRTCIYDRTLEDVQREAPQAVRMTLDEHCRAKAERQRAAFTWEPTTRARYFELLECLPPAAQRANGFLVGEPWDHDALTGQPRFQALWHRRGLTDRYVVSSRPLTRTEFHAALADA
jgi:hypothetical protein